MSDFINARLVVTSIFKEVREFKEIHRGVMNFKYQFISSEKSYIIRCYPKGRDFLADTEFKYMLLFEKLGIKAPHVYTFSDVPFPYLIYEMIEGDCLGEVFDDFDFNTKRTLCNQIYENFKLMSEIRASGTGCLTGYNQFQDSSWRNFLYSELSKSFSYLSSVDKPFAYHVLQKKMCSILSSKVENKQDLVWSDFNLDNIIVSKEGTLAGFIDFEGLLGGDSLLGIGYLQARNYDSPFYKLFYKCCNLSRYKEMIDFYSVLRYLRLVPYEKMQLPNGAKRMKVEDFLPNSINLINKICYEKTNKRDFEY